MIYPLIKIPSFATKSFYDFTKEDAREYFRWFLSIKDERVEILESYVKQIYPEWKASHSKGSLIELYEWFTKQVAYRTMTDGEKKAVQDQISQTPLFIGVIPIPKHTFTDETVSICFDTGIYLGESLINAMEIKWIQKLTSRKYIDYAQPLIGRKEGKVPINPRRIVESVARRILENDVKEIAFETIYDDWVENFK